MDNKSFFILIRVILCTFLCSAVFFIYTTKDTTYLGVRAEKNENNWIIKKIHSGGEAESTILTKGDLIVQLDNKKANDNKILNKWLIVEGVTEIQIIQSNQLKVVSFPIERNMIWKQLIFTFIASMLLMSLFIFSAILKSSYSYKLLSFFIVLLSFFLISIIPSSIGNDIARVFLIIVITYLPFFFLKFLNYGFQYSQRIKKFVNISHIYAVINFVLVVSLYIFQNYRIAEYLSIGILYIFGILLVLIAFWSVFIRDYIKYSLALSLNRINFPIVTILSFIPLFFFYILPIQNKAPFHLVVFFVILPCLVIIHFFLINRLIRYKNKVSRRTQVLMTLCTIFGSIWLLFELANYVSTVWLSIYVTLLLYAVFPIMIEFFGLISKQENHISGIKLFNAVEEERENIALHIHDTLIQEIIYELNKIQKRKYIESEELIVIFEEIIYELRELCTEIYPLLIQEIGLEQTIRDTMNSLQKKYFVLINLKIDYDINYQSIRIQNFLLRSIRESVTNSVKHGRATDISIQLYCKKNQITLKVIDNGKLQKQRVSENHFGIEVIRQKVKVMGGTVELSREKNQTKFILQVPISINTTIGG